MTTIGIIGCGAMGAGIAQLALQNGHRVVLFDQSLQAVKQAIQSIDGQLKKLIEKGKRSKKCLYMYKMSCCHPECMVANGVRD